MLSVPCPNPPEETPCNLLCESQDKANQYLAKLGIDQSGGELIGYPILKFIPFDSLEPGTLPPVTKTEVPVIFGLTPEQAQQKLDCKLRWKEYRGHLHTEEFGRVPIYGNVVSSTMNIANPFLRMPKDTTATAIARIQVRGRGGGGEIFVSPIGAAMFTLRIDIPIDSFIGILRVFLQYATCTAAIRGIKEIPGLDVLDLKFIWPNQIYLNGIYVGGVLVEFTEYDGSFFASVGCGIYVENSKPTTCINDAIKEEIPGHRLLTFEEVLGRTITKMEEIYKLCQEKGREEFLKILHECWNQIGTVVKFKMPCDQTGHRVVDATVHGLNDLGFLRITAKNESDFVGEKHLSPDVYEFDIEENVITMKSKQK